ncbi:hypothetical protein ACHAXM_010355 [Skeletonema potamos]|jgi:hypothetical protein
MKFSRNAIVMLFATLIQANAAPASTSWDGGFNVSIHGAMNCTDDNFEGNVTFYSIKALGNNSLCEASTSMGISSYAKTVVEKCGDTGIEGFDDGILISAYGCADPDCELCEELGAAVIPKNDLPRVSDVCYGMYPITIEDGFSAYLKYMGDEVAAYSEVFMGNTCMGEYLSDSSSAADGDNAVDATVGGDDGSGGAVDGAKVPGRSTSGSANSWDLFFLGVLATGFSVGVLTV